MTWGDAYRKFGLLMQRINRNESRFVDYRPFDHELIPKDKTAIIVWTDSDDMLVYLTDIRHDGDSKMETTVPRKSDCVHCLGINKNPIGEVVCFCEEYDLWRNYTLGDCIGNCGMQEKADASENNGADTMG